MESVNRIDDMEAGEDIFFARRWWRVQRFSWAALTLLLLGGLAGLLGKGPLSRATIHSPGSDVKVCYDRLARRETPAILELHLDRKAIAPGRVRIRLSHGSVDHMRIKQIVPEPLTTEPLADGARFTFETDPTSAAATVVFIEDPSKPGFVEGEVAVEGGDSVHYRQFVYP